MKLHLPVLLLTLGFHSIAPAAPGVKPKAAPVPKPEPVVPELVLQAGHSDAVSTIAFSPDGKTVASGSRDGTVTLWDAATGVQKRSILPLKRSDKLGVDAVSFSGDSQTVAVSNYGGELSLWNCDSGKIIRTLTPTVSTVNTLAFSADGRFFVAGGNAGAQSGQIDVWETGSGKLVKTLKGHKDGVNVVAFSSTGTTFASGGDDGQVVLWDAATGAQKKAWQLTGKVQMLRFTAPGTSITCISGDDDTRSANTIDIGTGVAQFRWKDSKPAGAASACSADGSLLATDIGNEQENLDRVRIASKPTILLQAMPGGKLQRSLTGHIGVVTALAFSADGKTLASGGADNSVRLWDVTSGALRFTGDGHPAFTGALAFASSSAQLASGSTDGMVRIWNSRNGILLHTVTGDGGHISSLAFAPDGKTVASGSNLISPGSVSLSDPQTGQLVRRISDYSDEVLAVVFSPDGTLVASTTRQADKAGARVGVVRLDELGEKPKTRVLLGHKSFIEGLAFFPDGKTIASGSRDGTIRLWDVATGELKRTIEVKGGIVWAVAVSPNGKFIAGSTAGAGGRGEVGIWDADSGALKSKLTGHESWVGSLAFSPDGQLLASGGLDGTVKVWDTKLWALSRTLTGHKRAVEAVAFSPSGLLVSGSLDVRFWNPKNGQLLATLVLLPSSDPAASGAAPAGTQPADTAPKPDWIAFTPEGYYDASPTASRYIRWRVKGKLVGAADFEKAYRKPALVQKALAGK